jgi:putative membrane protein
MIFIVKIDNIRLTNMALPFDFLDSMAWTVVASGVMLAILALRLPYKASSDSVEEKGRNLRIGFAATIGLTGLYLSITGLAISFIWPFASSGGSFNILFGGIAALSGFLLLSLSAALLLNGSLSTVSYFAVVVGLYAAVDAYAMVNYGLGKEPLLAALGYLSFVAVAFLSVPMTHSDNKYVRWIFAIFAFLFAIAWLYQASNFTWEHLAPPS